MSPGETLLTKELTFAVLLLSTYLGLLSLQRLLRKGMVAFMLPAPRCVGHTQKKNREVLGVV